MIYDGVVYLCDGVGFSNILLLFILLAWLVAFFCTGLIRTTLGTRCLNRRLFWIGMSLVGFYTFFFLVTVGQPIKQVAQDSGILACVYAYISCKISFLYNTFVWKRFLRS